MTIGGILVMTLSVGFVTVFFGWSLWTVVTRQAEDDETLHSILDTTPDSREE